jgi:alanyl-tRNA synthetase
MTERLYYADAYLKDFEATVLERGEDRVYLERSAFYPTSGGQAFDLGTLQRLGAQDGASARVVDVVDEGERVAHVLEPGAAARFSAGESVRGQIDWARRFDHMQQHSGQHLLSAVFQRELGFSTLSVHFGAEVSTLDLDVGALSAEQLQRVEERANAAVFENHEVHAQIEAAADGLRKPSARQGGLRVVTITSLDRSACGGTHVARTGEIGPILLMKLDRVRKATRVEFVCGARATRRARADYAVLAKLGGLLGTSVDSLAEVVTSRLAELKHESAQLRATREQLDAYRAAELYGSARAQAAAAGLVVALERSAEGNLQDVRGLAQRYIQHPRAVLIALVDRPASILLAASEDTGVDAGAVLKAALAAAGGRGGGTARVAQGTVSDVATLSDVLGAVRARLGTTP